MKYAKPFAVSLVFSTLVYNNCGNFKPLDAGSEGLSSNAESLIGPDGQYPKIASNFDPETWINQSSSLDVANSYGFPDVIGAFRFTCKPSHNLYDDPIVYPGRPGASHLHTFFGNTKANAHSTYQSLRSDGEGTCTGGPLNRSAYWMPALQLDDGDGDPSNDKVVMPENTIIYYKMLPEDAMPIPRGLRFIFGYDMNLRSTGSAGNWTCGEGEGGIGGVPGEFKSLKEVADAGCPAGSRMKIMIGAPHCWNGELDSPDHRSHLASTIRNASTNWESVCPPTHPRVVPSFSLGAIWVIGPDGPAEIRRMYLSSDYMHPQQIPGSTFHTDWFGAWDDDVMEEWMGRCVADFRNCSSGVFGNGRGLKDPRSAGQNPPYLEFADPADPRLIDPPPPPSGHHH